ncbi:trichohyalin [Pseudomyrmex gracilis]|uniref:trichohyalin n=1 Tax=Pseudomyrmex gracilis TaxID=219809 RepID=UPI000994F49D|nr:trichohyalin [Pseudomyrmex gracilis]XP_020290221.1 trichohyalin [Pseudomyrmex gracilis]
MTGRTSLVEQKRLQWAKEREEMARLGINWGPLKSNNNYRTHIRTYSNDARLSLGEIKEKPSVQPFRATGHYGSTVSLKSLATESSGNGNTNLKCLDYNGGSLINLRNQANPLQIRRRSPSLPPIFSKEQQQYLCQLEQQRDLGVDGSHYQPHRSQKQEYQRHRSNERRDNQKESHHYGSPGEEREGETSGYASDSADVPQAGRRSLADGKATVRMEMTEKMWQNPYCTTPESSLPPSRRISPGRICELNRPRWGSIYQDAARDDPPPPSWLSRLGHSSQVLVINHDSASSPDSSTTGSTGSDTNKVSYLRGQNIPTDANILQEREARRQKALELQNAIKQQLEEKDRQRKEEKERRMREEKLEDERIRREQEREKERFEEEQRLLREKEAAKLKKAQAMREVLEAAERLAKEEKKIRRKREEHADENADVITRSSAESNAIANGIREEQNCSQSQSSSSIVNHTPEQIVNYTPSPKDVKKIDNQRESENDKNSKEICTSPRSTRLNKSEENTLDLNLKSLQVPVSKDVAIVLSGRLEDPDILSRANLQLVNLVMTPSPRRFAENTADYLSLGLNTILRKNGSARNSSRKSLRDTASVVVENRLLTPSKYRTPAGRDFGTQTDVESDLQELRDKLQDQSIREEDTTKDRKDTTNASRKNVEKSTNNVGEEISMKTLSRSKSQPRNTLDTRPRWNANRPGTRYRTQSEKDPHYQRRLRLRRRQVESSDEGSRSPSPDRRKSNNGKSKNRNAIRRKVKLENYDADLSMDSLNSVVPLRIDKNGKINIEDRSDKIPSNTCNDKTSHAKRSETDTSNVWCGQEILSQLSSLKSGLLMKQVEWDSERCLVSPAASEIF